jgi:hypothetical protein
MMLKVYSKKVISTIVASSLIFGLGNAVASAAPKNDAKETGRTEQNVQTGVINVDKITVPRYAKEIQLTGTVVIDGPQLVVTIPGSETINVTKVGDKVWKYIATVDVSAIKGDKEFEISAHTIYQNGKNAGSIHTSAPTAIQKVHVPYVTSTVAEKAEWTDYDRSANQFNLSYNEVQNWSVGDPVITAKTLAVNGFESEVTILGTTLEVPTAIQDFTISQEVPTWEFDSNTKTYSAAFYILITDSKGHTTTESVTKTGLIPGQVNTVSHSLSDEFGSITKTHEFTAPELPVVQVVPVELSNLQLSLVAQNKNQFKVFATYTILYSDNSMTTVENALLEGGTISNPVTQNQNSTSKEYTIGGFVYNITVTYNSSTDTYHVTAVLKN